MNGKQSWERTETTPAVSIKRLGGRAVAVPSLLLLLAVSACGNGEQANGSLGPAKDAAQSTAAAPSPSASAMASTPCETEEQQTTQAADTFICTEDGAGALVWLEASASKTITDKRAANVAAKAAAKAASAKATAEKAAAKTAAKVAAEIAAAKAAAEKAAKLAAQQAAAKKAAEATAAKKAAEAAQRAAEAKAAQEAAAAKAAEEQAAQQALVPPPAAAPSGCDPNYSGACVPIASDVDCAGGSGNGPAYVQGPVTVTGSDIYGLDRDSDGVGCEG
jgi:hypothetical protein